MPLDYFLGHNVRLFSGASAIAHARDCKMSFSKETKKINHKDIDPGTESGGFSSAVGGVKSVTGTCTAYVYKTGSSLAALKTAWLDDTVLTIKFTTDETGDFVDTVDCIVTSLEQTATDGEVVEYSVTFESVDAVTFGVVGP